MKILVDRSFREHVFGLYCHWMNNSEAGARGEPFDDRGDPK
jgi:hypothetical protein